MLFLKSLKRYKNKNSFTKCDYCSVLCLSPKLINGLDRAYMDRRLLVVKVSASAHGKAVGLHQKCFWNQTFDKGRLKNFVLWFFLKYGEHKTVRLVEELKTIGFQYATKAGISLGVEDLKIPPKKAALIHEAESLSMSTIHQYKRGEITEVERFQRLIDTWHRTSEQLKVEVIENFEGTDVLNPVYMMAFSGARGNISQVRQLVGMRGLMSNPQGQIIDFPIRSNFREGLTLTEYIISSYGARKGIVDTALRTANAGYLTRRLVDVAQHVIISSTDCGTNRGIFLTDMKEGNKTIYSLQNRLIGRVLARDIYTESSSNITGSLSPFKNGGASNKKIKIASKNTEISGDLATLISQHHKKVFVRSPLTCQTNKLVCQLCYGWSLAQGNLVSIGEAVGIVAAQSIGEPGTQLTMRTFHTGGVFAGNVSDQIKVPFDGFVIYKNPIAGKLIRTPEGKIAFLTKDEGSFSVYKFPTKETPSDIDSASDTSLSPFKNGLDGAMGSKNLSPKLLNLDALEKRNYKIPFYTLLFSRNGEKVFHKQVIAQITSINRQKTATDQAEFTIKAEISGLFYSKNLEIEETKVGPVIKDNMVQSMPDGANDSLLDTINRSWSWGYAWILSGQIYQLPLPSSFFPTFGDFLTKKSFINCVNWYMPNTFGSGFKLNRPLNFTHFNTKSLKLMRKSSYARPPLCGGQGFANPQGGLATLGTNGPLKLDFTLNPSISKRAKGTKIGLIEKDFKLLKFDLISFELSKITYKNIGYFLKLSKPFSEGNRVYQNAYNQFNKNLTSSQQKNESYKKNVLLTPFGHRQLLETGFSQKSILSYQDNLFLFSSLFPRNRFFNDLKTNQSLQTNTRNPLINPTTWEPAFNVFLNWFPKRFFTQSAGMIFFDTSTNCQKMTLAKSSLYLKGREAMPTGHKTGLYSRREMSEVNLKVSKKYWAFSLSPKLIKGLDKAFSKNKKVSNSLLDKGNIESNNKLIENLKSLSFPTFFKKALLDPNNNTAKVNANPQRGLAAHSKTVSKNTKKSNTSYLPEKVRTQIASIDSLSSKGLDGVFTTGLQTETNFKNTLNKNFKLNTLLQTSSFEQYPQNLLGSHGLKASDGATVVFEESKILGYPWKNGFKYNWGLLNFSSMPDGNSHSKKLTKNFNIFERAFLVRQPFYKIRDKNNSIVIGTSETLSYYNLREKQLKTQNSKQNFSQNVSTKSNDLALIQSNRQGKTRLIEFIENCAQIMSLYPTSIDKKNTNKVKEFCQDSWGWLTPTPKASTELTKKVLSVSTKVHQQKIFKDLPFKRDAFYKTPTSFGTSNKKQESLIKRNFIFSMLRNNVKEFYSIPEKHRKSTKPQNKITTLKSYCKTTSIPYFLPKKIQNLLCQKAKLFDFYTPSMSESHKRSNKNLYSMLSSKKVKIKAKKHNNVRSNSKFFYNGLRRSIIFNFYFYSLFNKKSKHLTQTPTINNNKGVWQVPENFKKLPENKYQLICSPYLELQLEQKVDLSMPFINFGHTQTAKTEMFQRSQQLQNWFKKALYIENIYFEPKKFKKWYRKMVRHDLSNWDNLSIAKGLKLSNNNPKAQQQKTYKISQKKNIMQTLGNTNSGTVGGALPQETKINLWLKNGYFYYTTDLAKFFLYNKKIIQPGTFIDSNFSFDKNTIYLEIIPLKKLTTEFLLETKFNNSLTNIRGFAANEASYSQSKMQHLDALNVDTDNKKIQGKIKAHRKAVGFYYANSLYKNRGLAHIALNKKVFIKEQNWLKSFQKENKITISKPFYNELSQGIKEINPILEDKAQSKKIIATQTPSKNNEGWQLDFSQTIFNKNCRFKVEKTNGSGNGKPLSPNKAKRYLEPQFTELKPKDLNQKNNPLNSLGPKDIEVANYIIFIRKTSEYQFVKEIEYKKDIYSLSNQKPDILLTKPLYNGLRRSLSTIKVNNISAPYMSEGSRHKDKKNNISLSPKLILGLDGAMVTKIKTRNSFNLTRNCLPQKTIKPLLKGSSNTRWVLAQLLQTSSKNKAFVGFKHNKAFLNFQCTKLKKRMLNQSFHSIRLFSNYQTGLLNKQKTTGQFISKYGSSQLKLIFNNTVLSEIIKKENKTRDILGLAPSSIDGNQKAMSIATPSKPKELRQGHKQNGKTNTINLKNNPLRRLSPKIIKGLDFDKVRTWGLPSLMMTSLKSFNLSPFILSYKSPYSVNFPFKTPMCFFSQQYQPSFLFNNPWTGPYKTEMLHQDSSSRDTKIKTIIPSLSPKYIKGLDGASRVTRNKQLKNIEYATLKQLLSNYIYKIESLNSTDKHCKTENIKKDTGYNNKKFKNNVFEIGKNFSNLSSIFLSPMIDYSLINEFPKSIPASLLQEQSSSRGSSVDRQRASIFDNTSLKKQTLFHSDNKKFLFGKNGPLLPSLASGSPTSNNSFSRFNQTNEDLALNNKKVLYKTDFVSYIDNSVNSQYPVMKTYAYSSLEGELVYQKKTFKKMDLEPSILYKDIITLKKGLPGLSINKLIRQKFTDFFLSTKPVDHIDYSCMILTKKDQFCYSLSPKSIEGSFSGKQKKPFKQKYKEIYFSLENQKKETQYFINNIVINLLNLLVTETNSDISMASTSSDTNKTTSPEESLDSSKIQMDDLFSGLLKMDLAVPSNAMDGQSLANTDVAKTTPTPSINNESWQLNLKNTKTTLAESRALELNKIPAGLAQQRSKLLIGEFLVYGDKINPELAISKSGQIIHINNHKITLRKGQPIFVSPQAILHKYDGDFIEEQSSVITLAYQQLKTGDIVQGIPKIEQFFEARTTKRGRLFRDSLDNLLKAIFNRYNTKLPRDQAVRQSFYKIQQIIMDGVQRVYRSQGVTIADKHLEVIVKQMTSKVRITFGGSTGYLPGEICDLYDIELINKDIRPKILYEPMVLGITKASLEVKSFLSAASFQQTTRVLTKAALSRKTDYLNGLKENVILGNLIPAGTGYLVYLDQYSTNQ